MWEQLAREPWTARQLHNNKLVTYKKVVTFLPMRAPREWMICWVPEGWNKMLSSFQGFVFTSLIKIGKYIDYS
jgi:hypothetical protein